MKIKSILSKSLKINKASLVGLALVFSVSFVGAANMQTVSAGKICGRGGNKVETKFDLGCNQGHRNPIMDMIFSFIRFLSFGVGIMVIISIILAGIQYSMSQGNPEKTAQSKDRIQNSILALMFYLFIFAIIQYLVPGGLFN